MNTVVTCNICKQHLYNGRISACGHFLVCETCIQYLHSNTFICEKCSIVIKSSKCSNIISIVKDISEKLRCNMHVQNFNHEDCYKCLKYPLYALNKFKRINKCNIIDFFKPFYIWIEKKKNPTRVYIFLLYYFRYLHLVCEKCFTGLVEYIDFNSRKILCRDCINNYCISPLSVAFVNSIKGLVDELFNNIHPSLYILDDFNPSKVSIEDNIKLYLKIGTVLDLGKDIQLLIKHCLFCKAKYDFVEVYPLIFNCKYSGKHFYCSLCFLSNKYQVCKLDGCPISDIKVFYDIAKEMQCINTCKYLGNNYYELSCGHCICENCKNSSKHIYCCNVITPSANISNISSFLINAKTFFHINCKIHKKIAVYYSESSLEIFCVYCKPKDKCLIDYQRIYEIINKKLEDILTRYDTFQHENHIQAINSINLPLIGDLQTVYWKYKEIEAILRKDNFPRKNK